jgi:hypothetical protein
MPSSATIDLPTVSILMSTLSPGLTLFLEVVMLI